MDSVLISQFIDDELTLGEKEQFVNGVRREGRVYGETLALLAQERSLRQTDPRGPVLAPVPRRRRLVAWRPVLALAASFVILLLSVLSFLPEPKPEPRVNHRFLIHAPDAAAVAVLGDFTAWQPVALSPVGGQGYWELTLALASGAYRYAFLVNGKGLAPDPTVTARERDDFGGVNSILKIEKEEV